MLFQNGHTCPALLRFWPDQLFPGSKTKTYAKLGSLLQETSRREKLPGLETTSGPLGCSLAQASGMALASRMDNSRFRFCTVSDAEHDEGNHWEAVLLPPNINSQT